MHLAKISSQRQITIPKRILDDLGLEKYDRLVLEVSDGRMVGSPRPKGVVERTAGALAGSVVEKKKGKSMGEIKEKMAVKVAKKLADD